VSFEIDIIFVKKDLVSVFGFDKTVSFILTVPFDSALSHYNGAPFSRIPVYRCQEVFSGSVLVS
jgi:hypothetical protein